MKKATISAAVLAATLSFNANAFWAPSEDVTACRAEHPEWQESFNRLNPTTLTAYQVCRAVAEDNLTGMIGRNLYIITGDVVTYVPVLEIRGKSKDVATEVIEAAVVESLIAEEKAKLEEAIAELEAAQKEIDDLEQALVDLGLEHEQVVEALNNKHEDAIANLESAHAKALVAAAQEKAEAIAEQQAIIDGHLETIATHEATIDSLNDALDAKDVIINTHVETIASKNATIAEHVATIAAKNATINEHLETIADLNGDITDLEGEVTEKDAIIDGLEDDVAELEAEIEDLKAKVTELEGEITTLEGTVETLNTKNAEQKTKIEELEGEIETLKAALVFNGVTYGNAQEAFTAGANQTADKVNEYFQEELGNAYDADLTTPEKIDLVASEAVKAAIAEAEDIVDTLDTIANLDQLKEAAYFGSHDVVTDHDKNASSEVAHVYSQGMVTWTISDTGYDDVVKTSSGAWGSIADVIEDAYDLGFDRGYDSGYEDGYVDGYKDGFEDGVASVVNSN